MDLGVRGKNYIVIGGSKGMGLEAAQVLANDGANIAIISRNRATSQTQADRISTRYGVKAIGLGADASNPGELEDAIAETIDTMGEIRGLLATPGSTDHNGTLLEMSEEDWLINFNNVLMSQVRSCKAILPHMLKNGGGNIVTTSAYSARAAKNFLFGYATLKAGLINLTKNVAKTYGADGIRANCICPGAVETSVLAELRKKTAKDLNMPEEEALEHILFTEWKMPVSAQRVAKPAELGDMMAFLLSERAAYTTGAIVNVDGGTDF